MNDEAVTYLKQIAESIDLLVKVALETNKGERSQKEMILYLDSLGVAGARIAEYLGTSTANVYPTLSRERKKTGPKARKK